MSFNINEVSTIADYAAKVGTSAQNLKAWVEKTDFKPVAKFGNSNVYLIAELVKAVGEHSNSASVLRSVGYIHPDQYRALEDLHSGAASEAARYAADLLTLQDEYDNLLANFNGVQAELNQLQNSLIINGSEGDLDMSVFETSE